MDGKTHQELKKQNTKLFPPMQMKENNFDDPW